MFRFRRKKQRAAGVTASTFVKATGGGWSSPTRAIRPDGGEDADYVVSVLQKAHDHAVTNGVSVGEKFEFTITEIPVGIESPHEIIFALMWRANEFGLSANVMQNETVFFTRIE